MKKKYNKINVGWEMEEGAKIDHDVVIDCVEDSCIRINTKTGKAQIVRYARFLSDPYKYVINRHE